MESFTKNTTILHFFFFYVNYTCELILDSVFKCLRPISKMAYISKLTGACYIRILLK